MPRLDRCSASRKPAQLSSEMARKSHSCTNSDGGPLTCDKWSFMIHLYMDLASCHIASHTNIISVSGFFLIDSIEFPIDDDVIYEPQPFHLPLSDLFWLEPPVQ